MTSGGNADEDNGSIEAWMTKALAAKQQRRRDLARLPFDEKTRSSCNFNASRPKSEPAWGCPPENPGTCPTIRALKGITPTTQE